MLAASQHVRSMPLPVLITALSISLEHAPAPPSLLQHDPQREGDSAAVRRTKRVQGHAPSVHGGTGAWRMRVTRLHAEGAVHVEAQWPPGLCLVSLSRKKTAAMRT